MEGLLESAMARGVQALGGSSTPTKKPVSGPSGASNPFDSQNPFTVNAPTLQRPRTVGDAVQAGAGQATAFDATAYDASASRAQASQADTAQYEAVTDRADQGEFKARTVQDNELVQKQLEGIISGNSPLLQRARALAEEQVNARGLINSSMAAGAATGAVYDRALEIATPDAKTFAEAAKDNQHYQQSMEQFNVNSRNAMKTENMRAINESRRVNMQERNETNRLNAELSTRVSITNADNETRVSIENAKNRTEVSRTNATNRTNVSINNAEMQTRVSIENARQTNENRRFDAGAENDYALKTADMQLRAAIQNSSNQMQAWVTRENNNVAKERDATAAGSEIWRQHSVNMTNILMSDMSEEAKQRAVAEMTQNTRQSLIASRALDQAEVDRILTMPGLPMGPTAPQNTGNLPAPNVPVGGSVRVPPPAHLQPAAGTGAGGGYANPPGYFVGSPEWIAAMNGSGA